MATLPPGWFWLASYPKSGNTWLRILLANLLAGADGPVDINDLGGGGGIASDRNRLDEITLLDSGLLTPDEVEELRPHVYADMLETETQGWCKVHDAYTLTAAGEPLLGRGTARAAVYIVRDPRDVVISASHHFNLSLDESVALLNASSRALYRGQHSRSPQLRQKLLNWSEHAASWLEQGDLPVHLMRYEDLLAAPGKTFQAMLAFLGCVATTAEIERAVRHSAFPEVQRQERSVGFRELPYPGKRAFFRNGKAGDWADQLSPIQVRALEQVHGRWMSRLGYELSSPELDPVQAFHGEGVE